MKAAQMVTNRFGSPQILTGETNILGATAAEWQEQLTGGFRMTFDELKAREEVYRNATVNFSDAAAG
ncbi:hypothetical protein [Pseudomonas sp.]|uniref:hypothetical protein n=1 Tax=Pseudomonas sp. TaxID=306 RepID=UPI0026041333|nr:hypothetical protein [Pseudomonas sp.]